MLDINEIRTRKDELKKVCIAKNRTVDINTIIALDDERKSLQKKIDDLKFAQKQAGERRDIETAKKLKIDIQDFEKKHGDVEEQLRPLLLQVPNFIHPNVPIGKDENENVVAEEVGQIPSFSFIPKSYLELLELHDMADFARGTKLAGARGYLLKNDGMLLERAVLNYALDAMVKK